MLNWIATTKEEYIIKAKEFSLDINQLSKIRASLRKKSIQSPVFNSVDFSETRVSDTLRKTSEISLKIIQKWGEVLML